MHYYQFNIGDYISHTSHLDDMEDLAYRRMLDWYYLHESPLPNCVDQVAKLIRMRTHTESIASVLHEFFILNDYGWSQKKADEQIEAYQTKSDKAKAAANARWGNKPHANALKTQCEGNANQEPLTINQEPLTKNHLKGSEAKASPVPYRKIEELYNSSCPNLPQIKILTDKRKAKIKKFWDSAKEYQNLDFYSIYFAHANSIPFLQGKNDRGWKADIEFLMNVDSLAKIAEGKYSAGDKNNAQSQQHNYPITDNSTVGRASAAAAEYRRKILSGEITFGDGDFV